MDDKCIINFYFIQEKFHTDKKTALGPSSEGPSSGGLSSGGPSNRGPSTVGPSNGGPSNSFSDLITATL